MIRLFVTDIDGCIAKPYRPFNLDVLSRLRARADEAGLPGTHVELPALSICSGRSYPYVEAVSQVLGLKTPVLFESGAGLFDPVKAVCKWHPELDDEAIKGLSDVRAFLIDLVGNSDLSVDLAKRSQVAVVAPEPDMLREAIPIIEAYVRESHPSFRTFLTPHSVDVVTANLTKRRGISWLASSLGLKMSEVAFIGDTEGDIEALQSVGCSYAPSNADTHVKEIVDKITDGSDADGVLEAYNDVVQFNRRANREDA